MIPKAPLGDLYNVAISYAKFYAPIDQSKNPPRRRPYFTKARIQKLNQIWVYTHEMTYYALHQKQGLYYPKILQKLSKRAQIRLKSEQKRILNCHQNIMRIFADKKFSDFIQLCELWLEADRKRKIN